VTNLTETRYSPTCYIFVAVGQTVSALVNFEDAWYAAWLTPKTRYSTFMLPCWT